ncbi:hypothetical protein EOS_10945 [Caballeronia mineralivorans PML1(12)]|uniref:Uncharacterized protein n=1 Tax=Caballeronia mineralivorans PML1(12) TaxID=908627 RepID=A0A0J1D0Y1_9BURK|nr:hypothetical protein [Caballeronia mineralivorans]KLU26291.1 hypothetical protein EOS_10945 [Caballeronia mineralivorans PML1(12)]
MTFAIADMNMNAPGKPVLKNQRVDIKNTARRDQLKRLVCSTKRYLIDGFIRKPGRNAMSA